ncbi:M14 family metallopeptidase [Noviherbaspirillum sp.]|jgi:hypothetical protein|uniref:M14 family metallopeptidase n=1 Tax=Noviherbaspirillum sp. TaxID=1926288 RepID=UPI0025E85003|nr:M14 family metallopeptidase [Noviherbaspirillum sp.]
MNYNRHFSQSYAEARSRFLSLVAALKLEVNSFMHPLRGRNGEALAMDVVLSGAKDAPYLLIISSACHGVEGYCGSGIQSALLSDSAWTEAARNANVAVLYIHAINPYGFSWCRRTTHENVDLNRNFHDFSKPLPENPAYDQIASLLVPQQWPPSLANKLAIWGFTARKGIRTTQAVISGGQHSQPQGLFFGGNSATWSNKALRSVLREYGQPRKKIAWIDLHSGLGPSGVGERIFACRNEAAALQRARTWWGPHVTSTHDGSSISAAVSGKMWSAIYDECPHAEYTGITMEYGTLRMRKVMEALRAEQWLENHPDAPEEQRIQIKRQIRDAFYVDNEHWKRRVVEQAQDAAVQAIQGLAAR